ncbi:U32 family peptidase [Pseudolabrys sp. FHR47]|uniref:ubiquinone anaerobic biosynthesis protein UbiV n=1 Tax=Pseudolabrys sp. FHR47 TaxID=2562284 RepID=UPI0010BE8B96|nr:U32 family peptidase [Pseudolabrys sp. FHR47]
MAIAQAAPAGDVTLGPVLFNWAPEAWRDFYFRIADEAPVEAVYLGEIICSKRAPLFAPHMEAVAARLAAAGKAVVFSSLTEVMSKLDRKLVDSLSAGELVEANDASAFAYLHGRPHHIGPFINVYNERTLAVLARGGACNVCLPVELPATAIRALSGEARKLDVTVEVQVFGRLPLALSARCYHARAHGRTKDSCQFVCENDPDGLVLRTLENKPFLTVNGIQTLSYEYLDLSGDLATLQDMGIRRFRLSPHSCDMVAVATVFRDALHGRIDAHETQSKLEALKLEAPFVNGFFHGKAGTHWQAAARH